MVRAAAHTSPSPISVVISASFPRSRSVSRRDHASRRSATGRMTESMPRSETPRRINGATELGKSIPPASPQAATAPPYRVIASTFASVVEPTVSIPAAKRSFANGFTGPARSCRGDDLGRTEPLQIAGLLGASGRGCDLKATPVQNCNRDRADAAGSARDHHRSAHRGDAVALERHDREHGGIARSADRHGLAWAHLARKPHQPVPFYARPLGKAAEMGLAAAPAVENDPVARLPFRMGRALDDAREVDPGDHGKAAHHRSFARDRKTILVVERRPSDADGDVAIHQIGRIEVGKVDLLPDVGFLDDNGSKRRHGDSPIQTIEDGAQTPDGPKPPERLLPGSLIPRRHAAAGTARDTGLSTIGKLMSADKMPNNTPRATTPGRRSRSALRAGRRDRRLHRPSPSFPSSVLKRPPQPDALPASRRSAG